MRTLQKKNLRIRVTDPKKVRLIKALLEEVGLIESSENQFTQPDSPIPKRNP